ncbi:hypothetical protein FisN_24Hh239 [Fistulifera solaris]|uniref:Chitin-binding type-4 domain-containing protein n=1 Tax=Fistulifera solaris TaxID=1519565 RepID=A0A1Z5K365_FISSO|nr:hypothetical protein FisN_24Hh239 [Fistulifera solaris]|eukprot:GAX20511.1 hypothetical protein FisN_24Hh239 [Fistulifera solaris]
MQHKQMIASLGSLLSLFSLVHSHGYVSSPRARNWVAHENGTDGQEAGKAKKEYCPHCLNRNNGVCGYTDTNDYDEWVDSLGNVIPWESQGAYNSGDVIRMNFTIPVHHGGHIEIRACPNGRSSTWDCFTDPSRSLLFVKDLLYDIPADPIHPDRGYLAGWSEGYTEYVHDYQLPQGLYGEEVLIQWKYITSNSCKPPNYDAYFSGGNSQVKVLPSEWYSPTVSDCNLPYPQSGDPSLPGTPEQFFGCIEVSVAPPPPSTASGSPVQIPVSAPVAQPTGTVAQPTEPASPVTQPIAPVTEPTGESVVPTSGAKREDSKMMAYLGISFAWFCILVL